MAKAEGDDLPWHKRGRGKYGKYLPHQRFNSDQASAPPCSLARTHSPTHSVSSFALAHPLARGRMA